MESPIRLYQKQKDYQRHKLFRKIKRRRERERKNAINAPIKELRRRMKQPVRFRGGKDQHKEKKYGYDVEYMSEAEAMKQLADNMNKSAVMDEVVVTPSRKLPMQSELFEGITNQAANERADEYANRTSLTPGRFLGLMGANIPLAAGALGATVAAPALFDSTIAPLSDYVANSSIAGIPTTTWIDTALKSGFAGRGLNHAINEGIDGWGDAAMTALEVMPLGELVKPVYKSVVQPGMRLFNSPLTGNWTKIGSREYRLSPNSLGVNGSPFESRVPQITAENAANITPEITYFYHGSPVRFNNFSADFIGSGEGGSKVMRGINLWSPEKIGNAPKFANIKSPDVPLHLGVSSTPLGGELNPTVYDVSGRGLKLYTASPREVKGLSQSDLISQGYDGIQTPNQVTVFPESIGKLSIDKQSTIEDFIRAHPEVERWATWTTDNQKMQNIIDMSRMSKWTPEQWTAAQDAAIARGDMAEAQRLRDLHFKIYQNGDMVDINGNPIHVYHGSPEENITEFYKPNDPRLPTPKGINFKATGEEGIYTSPRKGYAANYMADLGGRYRIPLTKEQKALLKAGKTREEIGLPSIPQGRLYDLYSNTKLVPEDLNIEFNPFTLSTEEAKLIKSKGYSGFDIPGKKYPEHVVLEPNQLKLADAVTYDDNGVRIPLGERDNFGVNDIRYGLLPIVGMGALKALDKGGQMGFIDSNIGYQKGKDKNELDEVIITPDKQYNIFLNSLPYNQRYTPNDRYDTKYLWELNGKPRDFNEAVKKGMYVYNKYDKSYHAPSVSEDLSGNIRFMKPKTHSTVHMETDRYNKGLVYEDDGSIRKETPEEKAEFDYIRNNYDLVDDPDRPNYYMYRKKNLQPPKFQKGTDDNRVQQFASKVLKAPKGKYSTSMRKKANFAKNASKWKK